MSSLTKQLGILLICAISVAANAIDVNSTAAALRLANTITGGYMPTSDPLFSAMVAKVAAGDVAGAAQIAAKSNYAANYLARRLAFQMQNPNLDASTVSDSDATTYLIAHFVGAGNVPPSISSIWSENATYLVNITANGAAVPTHAAGLSAAQLTSVNWATDIVQTPGQTAASFVNGAANASRISIAQKDVGGYTTLSDRINDNSFAMYATTAGTNLRMIEGIWEVSTGMTLLDFANTQALAQDAPRFVPEADPNFFHGQGQPACISCHGGGLPSIPHGYSAVADVWDFDAKVGLTYITSPTTASRKSLGSDPAKRATNLACNLVATPTAVCNPDSSGVDPNGGWDVSKTWASAGILNTLGWQGPTSGVGLNALGSALGQATIVYEFLTKRVINEICPMGAFTASNVSQIAAAANPYANPKGTDDIRTIISMVASQSSCQ